MMMTWGQLISAKRPFEDPKQETQTVVGLEERSQFERDFDRVVYSSPFRRLQDKTQVIPFPETDFVHTRLTHSLEASCVGRSLGKVIGSHLTRNDEELKKRGITPADIGAIVSAACLAHDIGNPPFGHAGEDAISHYFLSDMQELKRMIEREDLNRFSADKKWQDLTGFEANANGFRLLVRGGGLMLTYSTLAAYTKYPRESSPKGNSNNVQERKYGFFQSEKTEFESIAMELGLISTGGDGNLEWARHPLAYLVEVADDICYSVMDLEDGIRLDYVPFRIGEDLLKQLAGEDLSKRKYDNITDRREQIGYLRSKAINVLAREARDIFLANEDSMLRGCFAKSLLECSSKGKILQEIEDTSRRLIYGHHRVKEIEAAGFEVLPQLLGMFIPAINEKYIAGNNKKYKAILELLPRQYLDDRGKLRNNTYERMLRICEFVAGMTDTYATIMYRRLKGVSLYGRFT